MYKQKRYSNFSRKRNYNTRRAGFSSFDPRSVIRRAKEAPVLDVREIKNSFSDFNLNIRLYKNIEARGFNIPTPIQDKAIPQILNGRDVVGVANTGTGKTAAFLIPLINKISLNRNSRVLIVTPTRELAAQIDKEIQSFSYGLGIYSALCIGGVSIKGQINRLWERPNFVVGTPGRLLDLEKQRKIEFSVFSSIVLDEVDRMLDMGFIYDINYVISKLPRIRQSLFFSATIDEKVKNIMQKFIVNPVMISVKVSDTRANVHQDVVETKGRNKSDILCEILDKKEVLKALIFTRTKKGADALSKILSNTGFKATVLHGDKTQKQRQRSLDMFGQGRINILIATDVVSRGIDVNDITHVINYDLPENYDAYIHRIGRTGRVDKKGVALTIIG